MLMLIVAGAAMFGYGIVFIRLPQAVAEALTALDIGPMGFMLIVMALISVLGMFLESIAIILVTTPILLPALHHLEIDLVWYGVRLLMNLELAMKTLPVGMKLFVVKSVTDAKMSRVIRGVLPYIVIMPIALGVILAVPELALWLLSTPRNYPPSERTLPMKQHTDRIEIVEMGSSEGFQMEGAAATTAQKIALIQALSETGLHHIQAMSFVSPRLGGCRGGGLGAGAGAGGRLLGVGLRREGGRADAAVSQALRSGGTDLAQRVGGVLAAEPACDAGGTEGQKHPADADASGSRHLGRPALGHGGLRLQFRRSRQSG